MTCNHTNSIRPLAATAWKLAILLLCAGATHAQTVEIDGFTAPFRSVDVATAESGLIAEILVRVGEHVNKGDVIAKLDDELHCERVEMAKQAATTQGRLTVARAELALDKKRLANLLNLQTRGNANLEEIARAQAEVEISTGQLLSIQEEILLRKHDLADAEILLRRRTVRAPLDGVVSHLEKEPGEYVGASAPGIMTIVQLDPLLAVFSIPSPLAAELRRDSEVLVRMSETQETVTGKVWERSPIIDGRSGTVQVKVTLQNVDRKLLSGEQCALLLPDAASTFEPSTFEP